MPTRGEAAAGFGWAAGLGAPGCRRGRRVRAGPPAGQLVARGAGGFGAANLGRGSTNPERAWRPAAAGVAAGRWAGLEPCRRSRWTWRAPSATGLFPPNDSRRRRATGASTVDDADFTNSPCSPSRARTSLLVTPSSWANSCTRALPAATDISISRGDSGRRRASGLAMTHGHRDFTVCSCSSLPNYFRAAAGRRGERLPVLDDPVVSGEPVIRNALVNARRRIASDRLLVGMQPRTPTRKVTGRVNDQ